PGRPGSHGIRPTQTEATTIPTDRSRNGHATRESGTSLATRTKTIGGSVDMPKMRGIKPEILTDEKVVSLTPLSRWLFIGMWMYACDNGHIEDSPVQLKMRILPMDECDVNALLGEQINLGLVAREDGYLRVTNLPKHQNIDKRYLLLC